MFNSAGLRSFTRTDSVGSTQLELTPNGTIYYDGEYAPFGESYAEHGTTDRDFTGQTQDTTGGI